MANGVNVAGFKGTVNDERWARLVPRAGSNPYGVVNANDCKVTIASGDRRVTVAPTTANGGVWGWGVFCEFAEATTLALTAPTSGSRWDLIVLRRNWANRTVTPVVVPGTAARALPTRRTNPGAEDDQPLALARVQNGSTTVAEVIDLRCFSSGGGCLALDELALDYLNHIGSTVRIGPINHTRMVSGTGATSWSKTVQGGSIGYSRPVAYREPTAANGQIAVINIPAQAFPYYISSTATVEASVPAGTRWDVSLRINGTVVDVSASTANAPWFQVTGQNWLPVTGGSSVELRATRLSGSGRFGISSYNQFFTAQIHPAL